MNSHVIIAAAGSGKTTCLVQRALSHPGMRICIVTYTNNNEQQIRQAFYKYNGSIPKNIVIITWMSFLLSECVRPYQSFLLEPNAIAGLAMINGRSGLRIAKSQINRYYLTKTRSIYSDKLAEFALACNASSQGKVVQRLEEIYDCIFIDEFQDVTGVDLDLVELLLRTRISLLLVGDPRQFTYSTNLSRRNKKYRGVAILELINKWVKAELCDLSFLNNCYRCSPAICAIADSLFPEMEATVSVSSVEVEHVGLFRVPGACVDAYMRRFTPMVLVYNKTFSLPHFEGLNFGAAKGLEFERVLIVPHQPIKKFLDTGDVKEVGDSREKLYVALTRARHSVGFVYDDIDSLGLQAWGP